jgi:hypothetical protein
MADRMDSEHASPIHGLSIWVGLAAFFSSSSDRKRSHDALKSAHDVKKAEKERMRKQGGSTSRGSEDGNPSEPSHGSGGMKEGMKRLGKALGIKKSDGH